LSELDLLIKQSLEKATTHTRKVYGQNPLTGRELEDLANGKALIIAATVKIDQRPHLSPVDLNILNGKIYIGIDEGTARHKNLTHNRYIAIIIAEGSKNQAIIEGETRMLDMKSEIVREVLDAQRKKYGWTTQLVAELLPSKIFTFKSQQKDK
jgi:pyridoxamine 5'-phosphate oxidase-like protein